MLNLLNKPNFVGGGRIWIAHSNNELRYTRFVKTHWLCFAKNGFVLALGGCLGGILMGIGVI
jgi:hypothetical protein